MKDRNELESMTKDELVDYADSLDIEVSAHWIKDDIIREILKGQKAAAKSEAKSEVKAEADKPESVKHMEANQASIKDEIKKNEALAKETDENNEILNSQMLPKEGETREQLLARIRKMREAPEPEPEKEVFRSPGQQAEFDAEQKAGKEAVAKAEEVKKKYEASLATADAGGKK